MKKLFYYFIIGLVTTSSIGVLTAPKQAHAACVVNSATFTPSGLQPKGDNSAGITGPQWYTDASQPKVIISVNTSGCTGKTAEISITERDSGANDDIPEFDNKPFLIPSSGKINILARVGETDCENDANVTGYSVDNADCHYFIEVTGTDISSYDSLNKPNGELAYECDGVCLNNWQYLTSSGDTIDPSNINTAVTVSGQQNFLNTGSYSLLAPIGSLKNISGNESVSTFLSSLFVMIIGLAGVFAVGSLIVSGFQYMLSDIVTKKSDAKDRIKNSLLGLLLVLGAYTILNTINPDLVNNLGLNIETQTIELIGDTNAPLDTTFAPVGGMLCNNTGGKNAITSIASSFKGNVTYRMGAKGKKENDTVYFDCSGFVNKIIQCAGGVSGTNFINGGTTSIFSGTGSQVVTSLTSNTANNIALQPGDQLGWKAGENGEKFGHVIIYVGNGQFMDSHGPADKKNRAIGTFGFEQYKTRIKYIRRAGLQ